jgi:serine/threonine protein kinase
MDVAHWLDPDNLPSRYQVLGVLHMGRMSAVYEARDLDSPNGTRLCAVKEILNLASDPAVRDSVIQNFRREAEILATLDHPAIPQVYDFFDDGSRACLVLELVRGSHLEALMNIGSGFLPVDQVRGWAIEICDALSYLHAHQPEPILFRDLKPSHVLIDGFHKVRLIDFGLTRAFDVTKSHIVTAGTEGYAPPEHSRGEVSEQGDIYALGATLHHILTRRDPRLGPPFWFEYRPIQLFNPDVPDAFVEIVNRALAFDPEERFDTVDEMKKALEAVERIATIEETEKALKAVESMGTRQPQETSYEGTLRPEQMLRGRYRIQRVLGGGGTGAVYQARDMNYPEVTKLCAVKEMLDLAYDPAWRDAIVGSLRREADVLASLDHPAIPEVYDFFDEGSRAYLVLEFVRGKNLERVMNSTGGFLQWDQVRRWAIEICDALGYLHAHQPEPIPFRDLKPSHVIIDRFGKVRLIDFGIAKAFDVTRGHTMSGTEGYSPPEQYRGQVSPQSDIYALGATLHHVLTRRDPRLEPPFSFENRPISEINPTVPAAFVEIVNRALAFDPEERFDTVEEMKKALEAVERIATIEETEKAVKPVERTGTRQPQEVSYEGTLRPEQVLRGRYLIQRVLRAGSTGAVYQARDMNSLEVTRLCAVKEILTLPSAHPAWRDTIVGNLRREADLLASLDHPAIPKVYDFFDEGNHVYLVLELVWGKDLAALAGGFLPVDQVRRWAIEICGVLDYLHSRQPEPVIFRDLKPSHVMIDHFSGVRLIDFGIAKAFDVTRGQPKSGTVGYSPPEQYRGEVSPQSDIYALGATLHHVLTRRDPRLEPPFSFENRPISEINPEVPEAFAGIVNRALASEPDERFSSAAEMKKALEALESTGIPLVIDRPLAPTDEVMAVWLYPVGDEFRSTPCVDKGVVYVGAQDNHLWALDAKEGSLVWKYPTAGGVASSPAVKAKSVFVGSEDRTLHAVNVRTGRARWTYVTEGGIYSDPRATRRRVFFGSDDHKLYAIKAANGRLEWSFDAQGPVRSSPYVGDQRLYFGTEKGDFYALSRRGKMVWRFKASRAITSSPTVHEDIVYFGSNDWTLYALDSENGSTIWRFQTQKPICSSPAYSDGKVYVGSEDGHLYAIDAQSGQEVWKYKTDDQITSSPLLYRGVVYVGSIDTCLYALNAETGDLLWWFGTLGPIVSSPAAEDGLVYIGSTDRRLYALKA